MDGGWCTDEELGFSMLSWFRNSVKQKKQNPAEVSAKVTAGPFWSRHPSSSDVRQPSLV